MSSSSGPNWVERHPVMCTASAAVIAALITGTATYTAQHRDDADEQQSTTAPTKVAPTGEITEPTSVRVGKTVHLRGWIKNAPAGYALWAYNEQVSSGKLWPAYFPCKINEAKTEWECPDLRIGGVNDGTGSEWKVRVALVTAENAVEIKSYAIAREYKNEQRDGFPNLPEGAIPIDEMNVVLE
ncbi:hypothetical protein ACFYN9_24835 [Streptomyces collinus]|uniref:hypothetical protein n=1 Tax=Streptomyces collinus TaxID=42684 RepID=UPI00368979E3